MLDYFEDWVGKECFVFDWIEQQRWIELGLHLKHKHLNTKGWWIKLKHNPFLNRIGLMKSSKFGRNLNYLNGFAHQIYFYLTGFGHQTKVGSNNNYLDWFRNKQLFFT